MSSTYKSVLQKRVLGSVSTGKEGSGNIHCDPFLRSMAYWILEDYSKALDTLIKHSIEDEGGKNTSIWPVRLVLTTCSFTPPFLKVSSEQNQVPHSSSPLLVISLLQQCMQTLIANVVTVLLLSCIP